MKIYTNKKHEIKAINSTTDENLKEIKIDETRKKVSILEAENEILKQELSLTQDAVNEMLFMMMNLKGE